MKARGFTLGLVALVSLVAITFLLWRFKNEVKVFAVNHPQTESEKRGVAPSAASPGTKSLTGASAASDPQPEPQFQAWIKEEARQVDQTHLDSEAKRKELATVIAHLTPENAKQLARIALSSEAPVGERILSTYLLVEGGQATLGQLQVLITSPTPDFGTPAAHSEAELQSVQERSLRIMAVDGLLSRAEHDPAALAALPETVARIPDAYIHNYAEKRARH